MPTASPFALGFSQAVKNPVARVLASGAESALNSVFGLSLLQSEYSRIELTSPEETFVAAVLRTLEIGYSASAHTTSPVPTSGPLIVVANHPFGCVEGMILLDYLRTHRANVKLLANYMLNRIPEMREHIVSVDPFELDNSTTRNIAPLREALGWLERGGVLGVFPSGTVSHLQVSNRAVKDPEWRASVARLIRRSGATVLPVYFHGRNSALFQVAGLVHPLCRTALLPRELLNKRKKEIIFEVGQVISKERLAQCESDAELVKYVRFCTHALKYRTLRKSVSVPATRISASEPSAEETTPIAKAVSRELLAAEVERIPDTQQLTVIHDFEVFYASAGQIPNLLLELGRVREISFRAAGEGTGRDRDIDRFDQSYLHLISWDRNRHCVVGAYRLGLTDKLIATHGLQGLYTHSLFDYSEELLRQLGPALELGRSFVAPEYQKSSLALFSLWRGIGQFVNRNPRYRRLFGLVSISSNYAPLSRSLMVSFLREHRFEPDWASLVKPRTSPKEKRFPHIDEESVHVVVKNIDDVTHLIADIEHEYRRMPVLLRQYLKLGGNFLGFSLDRSFGNVVDGLIVVDLLKARRVNLERYFTKEGVAAIYQYPKKAEDTPLSAPDPVIAPSLA